MIKNRTLPGPKFLKSSSLAFGVNELVSDSFWVYSFAEGIDWRASVTLLKPELSMSSLVITKIGSAPSCWVRLILEPVTITFSKLTTSSSTSDGVSSETSSVTTSSVASSSTASSTASSTTSGTGATSPGLSAYVNDANMKVNKNNEYSL